MKISALFWFAVSAANGTLRFRIFSIGIIKQVQIVLMSGYYPNEFSLLWLPIYRIALSVFFSTS
jgi:hypothetical protein